MLGRAGCETKRTGDAAEAHVLAVLLDAGLTVLIPWGHNARYDLVVDVAGRFIRVQCKTGQFHNGAVAFRTDNIGRNTARPIQYAASEIDNFAVWSAPAASVYLVPLTDVGKVMTPILRVRPPRPGSHRGRQAARIRWASAFEADRIIATWTSGR
jgi:hypothetical protein